MNNLDLRADHALDVLKDFQLRTVEYVFRRLWKDDPPALRFLVADEVGLGKTLVARGVIAKTLEHLEDQVRRIDIVYICSNATIAQQNISRLNVTGLKDLSLPTRLTLLPDQIHDLNANRVNFISLTPATSLETTKSRGGIIDERLVIWRMLRRRGDLPEDGLYNLLQCTMGDENYRKSVDEARATENKIDKAITDEFLATLNRNPALLNRLECVCGRFRERPDSGWSWESSDARYAVIGDLRNMLARVCVDALEPNLIILDEFQRFRDLLDGDSPAAELTRQLLDFQYRKDDSERGLRARVLLLSATPYKMLTLYGDEGHEHYEDFLRTCFFLCNKDEKTMRSLREDIRRYRHALLEAGRWGSSILEDARRTLEARLLKFMVRTERVSVSADRDAMLVGRSTQVPVELDDLRQAEVIDRVAASVNAQDPIEYWKSAPYLLNVMRGYQLKQRFLRRCEKPPVDLAAAIRDGSQWMLRRDVIEKYGCISPANPRLRKLLKDTVGQDQWKWLWMPPSLPYLRPSGPYPEAAQATKSLVFSSWVMVPDAIAALCSYEANRLMMAREPDPPVYSQLHKSSARLLDFRMRGGLPAAMNNLLLLYPSPSLAELGDPLKLALEAGGSPISQGEALRKVAERIRERFAQAGISFEVGTIPKLDQRWYWAAPAFLDRAFHPAALRWVGGSRGWRVTAPVEGGDNRGFAQHVAEFAEASRERLSLGPAPEDLIEVLALVALAGPAVCAYRALRRIVGIEETQQYLLQDAAKIAQGLRTTFNIPESIALVRAESGHRSTRYWESVLRYALGGNLQAVLDEYAHVLQESLGLMGRPSERVASGIATEMSDALSLRTSLVRIDGIRYQAPGMPIEIEPFYVRARFALRFGDTRSERGESSQRADTVRKAFNSPFRPFILASTSVGQEGLDFHTYCHAVYHWNLPSNPVDLEQREGRVHRYKGHAVRKNVAERFGLASVHSDSASRFTDDPWRVLFERAKKGRSSDANDLVPYWLFTGSARVERRVPLLAYSREVAQLERLKRSLAVYRLAFGQPRQEDLVEFLGRRADGADLDEFRISLEPPVG